MFVEQRNGKEVQVLQNYAGLAHPERLNRP